MKRQMKKSVLPVMLLCLAALFTTPPLWAAEESQTDLAKETQNPVADLISIPIQSNFNFNYGADRDKSQIVTNIQPVVPISLNKDWNLITRTILPVIYTEFPAYQTGLGNLQVTGFLSPAKPGKFIWGAGPVFQFPTTTDTFLGNKMWSGGPSAVGLTMQGPWVVGLLAQNVWSFAGRRVCFETITYRPLGTGC